MANWYIRKGGSDNNGGSSAGTSPDRTGTDGTINNASTAFTATTGAFVAGDVGKGLNIAGTQYRITARSSSTAVTIDRAYGGSNTSTATWNLGGALLTVGKITNLTVTTAVQAGDNVYIGAGTYREVLAMGVDFTVSQVNLIGDVDGTKTGDAGEVRISGYTTNDTTFGSNSDIVTPKNFWSLSNITFIATAGMMTCADTKNVTFTKCAFFGIGAGFVINSTTQTAKNLLFDRCIIFAPRGSLTHTLTTFGSGADYDSNIVYKNCVITAIQMLVTASGTAAKRGGGVCLYNSLLLSLGSAAFTITGANTSTTLPCKVENSIVISGGAAAAISAASAATALTEDYNYTLGSRGGTAGGHSVGTERMTMISLGQELLFGATPRPFGMLAAATGVAGIGATANAPTIDLTGANRPAGGGSGSYSPGPYERGNTFIRETSTTHTGANSMKCVGPGYQDFFVPVAAASTVLSIYLRYDSTYAGTRPQIMVTNGTECGVADQTVTASTSALNAWEQNSITVVPTAAGIVTFRVISNDTNGGGAVYADTFAAV